LGLGVPQKTSTSGKIEPLADYRNANGTMGEGVPPEI